jgi:hypothetical protein
MPSKAGHSMPVSASINMQNIHHLSVWGLRVLRLLPLIVLVGFSGCATPNRLALNPEHKANVGTTQTTVLLTQQEIGTDITQSNITAATGGGLIFALIDAGIENSRAKKAEKHVVPVRDALIGYNLGDVLNSSLKSRLASRDWLKAGSFNIQQVSTLESLDSWIKNADGDGLLLVNTQYRFTPKFDGITISARISIHPKQGPLVAQAKPYQNLPPLIYYNAFSATIWMSDWPAQSPDAEAAVKLWAEEGGKRARTALDLGADEIARMLAFDLEQPGTVNNALYKAPAGAPAYDGAVPLPGAAAPIVVSGHKVHEENNRVWLRCPTGELASIRQ